MSQEIIENFSVRKISILNKEGQADPGQMPSLSNDDIRTMYWYMNLARTLNARMINLQKQGRLGTFASTKGQEGGEVALAFAAKNYQNIWLVPTFRETPALLVRGIPMDHILQYWGGYEIGHKISKELKVLPVNIPVGSQLEHAQGIAHSMNLKGEKGAVIVFFGDGATSEGETHEALNFAGVFQTPILFFCQNNQYAISVPRKKQTAAETLAQKAFAYGYEGIQVDGNDPFATYVVVKQALEKALNGGGPTFIEAITYRLDHHTTADDWRKYRSEAEVQEWEKKDPILRLRIYMVNKGIWNDEHEKGMLADAEKRVEEAVQIYENTPMPKPEEMFDYLYQSLPPALLEQKEKLLKYLGEGHD